MSYKPDRLDIQGNWKELFDLVIQVMGEPNCSAYLDLLEELRNDQKDGFVHYLGMERAPAAKRNHHDFEGGLVHHLLDMYTVWQEWRPVIEESEHINDGRILRGIINHDLHKGWRTYVLESEDPWRTSYGKDLSDTLLTWDTKSIFLLMKHKIPMDLEQMNALLLSEGGYSRIKPKETTVLAKILYLMDEMSGNVQVRIAKGTLLELGTAVK